MTWTAYYGFYYRKTYIVIRSYFHWGLEVPMTDHEYMKKAVVKLFETWTWKAICERLDYMLDYDAEFVPYKKYYWCVPDEAEIEHRWDDKDVRILNGKKGAYFDELKDAVIAKCSAHDRFITVVPEVLARSWNLQQFWDVFYRCEMFQIDGAAAAADPHARLITEHRYDSPHKNNDWTDRNNGAYIIDLDNCQVIQRHAAEWQETAYIGQMHGEANVRDIRMNYPDILMCDVTLDLIDLIYSREKQAHHRYFNEAVFEPLMAAACHPKRILAMLAGEGDDDVGDIKN